MVCIRIVRVKICIMCHVLKGKIYCTIVVIIVVVAVAHKTVVVIVVVAHKTVVVVAAHITVVVAVVIVVSEPCRGSQTVVAPHGGGR